VITNLKEFDKFLAICRKHGVKSIKTSDVPELVFDDSRPSAHSGVDQIDIPTDALSPDDLIFYATHQPPAS
jgi:hypothetical protein